MGKTLPSFSQLFEAERRRQMPFRQALSNEDQEAVDRMCASAKQLWQAEGQLGQPWRFEAADGGVGAADCVVRGEADGHHGAWPSSPEGVEADETPCARGASDEGRRAHAVVFSKLRGRAG